MAPGSKNDGFKFGKFTFKTPIWGGRYSPGDPRWDKDYYKKLKVKVKTDQNTPITPLSKDKQETEQAKETPLSKLLKSSKINTHLWGGIYPPGDPRWNKDYLTGPKLK
jgi:hypothetical protein